MSENENEQRLTDAELSAQYGIEPPRDTGDLWRWYLEIGHAAGNRVSLAIQTAILERVPSILDDIRLRPHTVDVSHAKILVVALKIEEHRVEEATRIRQKFAEAQREHAVKCFNEVFGGEMPAIAANIVQDARVRFLEKIGV